MIKVTVAITAVTVSKSAVTVTMKTVTMKTVVMTTVTVALKTIITITMEHYKSIHTGSGLIESHLYNSGVLFNSG